MNQKPPPSRCRIVLLAGPETDAARLTAALAGGDVASVILFQSNADETAFQAKAADMVARTQQAGAAAVVAGDSRIVGCVQADGIHLEAGKAGLAEAIGRFQARIMVGAGGAKSRDDALELGEERPDYLFFGRFGYDGRPEPHPRNLSLGRWWAEMVEIPCIVMAGADIASVETVADTGAEFVALSAAVFGEGIDPQAAVARANTLLDASAPRFER